MVYTLPDVSMLKPDLFPTLAPPTDVALSRDNLTLSVCVKEGAQVKVLFYDVRLLAAKVSRSLYQCELKSVPV